jgi:hypothetical protein
VTAFAGYIWVGLTSASQLDRVYVIWEGAAGSCTKLWVPFSMPVVLVGGIPTYYCSKTFTGTSNAITIEINGWTLS